jgi:tRNA pseudouridine32 synthase / 23S rRNA pseudouridine746 synthase
MTDATHPRVDGPGPVRVLFEDADVLAVSKPEGLATIPERSGNAASLLFHLQAERGAKLFVVHRLDKEASGAILFAKNAAAHKILNGQFARREVAKTYAALSHGVVAEERGAIDRPIRLYGSGRMGIDAARGKPSSTEYEVVRRMGAYTLLDVRPASGRRHQIRVHLYSIGHPVVGDTRYGDRDLQSRFPRLMLHASEIGFRLPSGENKTVSSPLPGTFVAVLERVEAEARSGD